MKRRPEAPGRLRHAIATGLAAYVDGFEAQTEAQGRIATAPRMGSRKTRRYRMWVHGWNAGVAIDFLRCECNA